MKSIGSHENIVDQFFYGFLEGLCGVFKCLSTETFLSFYSDEFTVSSSFEKVQLLL